MPTAIVTSDFRLTVSKEIREQLKIKPGQKLSFLVIKGVLHIVPQPTIEDLDGYLKGMDTSDIRDEVDRF